jgi:chitodextrinase
MNSRHLMLITGIFLAILLVVPASAEENWLKGISIKDPIDQVLNMRHHPEALGFRLGAWNYDLGGGNHIQGIARSNAPDGTPYFFITVGEREAGAQVVIVRMNSRDKNGERLRSNRLWKGEETDDTPCPESDSVEKVMTIAGWKHAGGIQIIDHYLIVPLEGGEGGKTGSFAIYDVRDPPNPVLIYEHPAWDASAPETKIGVAGITREQDGRYLVLLGVSRGETQNKVVMFLRSTTSTLETSSFELINEQNPGGEFETKDSPDYEVWDTSYQTFNLVRDSDDESLYLFAIYSTSSMPTGMGSGDDLVHLFRVLHDSTNDKYSIEDGARIEKHFNCKSADEENLCNFIAAGGFYISPAGELILYAAQHYAFTDGGVDEIPMAEFRYRDMAIPGSPLWTLQAVLSSSLYEANEGDAITFDGTGSRSTFMQGWIDLYEDEDFEDSVIVLDWADGNLEDWWDLDSVDGFSDDADSLRSYSPCPSMITLCPDSALEGDCYTLPCGFNAIPNMDDLDEVGGDEADSVWFIGDPPVNKLQDTAEWNFGDGYKEGAYTVSQAYGDNGEYTVHFRVAEQDGDSDVTQARVLVHNVAPDAKIDIIVQPNPHFILPLVHTLTFFGTFTDPGWLDTHTSAWNCGDNTILEGILVEENAAPDATGTTTQSHVFTEPGSYTVTLTVSDDDGGSGTGESTLTVVSAREAMGILDSYIQGLPDSDFKANPAQRKNALHQKYLEIVKKIDNKAYQGAEQSLLDDMRAKADGSVGGDPANDWITYDPAQSEIAGMIDSIRDYLEAVKKQGG